MRRVLALAAMLAAAAVAAQPVTYTLDPDHSSVHFEVLHFGTSTIRGRFTGLQGEATLDRAAGRGSVGLRIATASVDTGIPVFDRRLREPDLLASASEPEAFFVARQFRFEGPALREVRGEFTLRGRSQLLSLNVVRFGCRLDPERRREVCGGDLEGEALRSDFGMSYGLPLVGNRVRLRVQVEAIGPEAIVPESQ
jgi:polyisoprenoid-binding protein YceI